MPLDEAQKLTVYNTVQSVLKTVQMPTESSRLEEIVRAVLTAAQEACADFSEDWNRRVSPSLAQRLPPEVLSECLRAADFTTRVRASHVSRAWRAIAIGDRRLWTTFYRTSFRDLEDQNIAFDQLETMLTRSDPLPFCVQLPHSYHGECEDFEEPLPGVLGYGIRRIQEYSGPCWVFSEARYYTGRRICPKLVSFSCLDPTWVSEDCEIDLYCSSHVMPNLRRLVGPALSFRDLTTPLSSLTSLCFHLSDEHPEGQEDLFLSCPNLISLDVRSVKEWTTLPPGPLPPTLRDVALHSDGNRFKGIDFEVPLMSWSEYRIPRLHIRRSRSLSTPVAAFLALQDRPVALSLSGRDGGKVTLSSDAFSWEIDTRDSWSWMAEEYFEELKTLIAERVTSITLPFEHLATFFHACIHAPRLVSLKITFDGIEDEESARLPRMPAFYNLQAPNLRRLGISIAGTEYDIRDRAGPREQVMAALTMHFRSFIAYDADQLDAITLRCAYPTLVDYSGLAQFAKEYIVVS